MIYFEKKTVFYIIIIQILTEMHRKTKEMKEILKEQSQYDLEMRTYAAGVTDGAKVREWGRI